MNSIISEEEFAEAVKHKTTFELSREFTFWKIKDSSDDLKLISREIVSRHQMFSVIIFFSVALFTNTITLFIEAFFSDRWIFFEDNRKDIIRQYMGGFLFLSLVPIIIGLERYFDDKSFYSFLIANLIVYGIALLVGFAKTLYDTNNFLRLNN